MSLQCGVLIRELMVRRASEAISEAARRRTMSEIAYVAQGRRMLIAAFWRELVVILVCIAMLEGRMEGGSWR